MMRSQVHLIEYVNDIFVFVVFSILNVIGLLKVKLVQVFKYYLIENRRLIFFYFCEGLKRFKGNQLDYCFIDSNYRVSIFCKRSLLEYCKSKILD